MTALPALIDRYDAALFDLDGVVYLGPVAVPGAAEGIAALRDRGTRIGFVTNNAARPPAAVAAHLVELGIPATWCSTGSDPERGYWSSGVRGWSRLSASSAWYRCGLRTTSRSRCCRATGSS